MIEQVVERWHRFVSERSPEVLETLLADDIVFYSPIIYAPQHGKALAMMYILGAAKALPGDGGDGGGEGRFRYTKEVLAGDVAVLEFETTVDGRHVNGVDILRCDEAGQIVEFRVMVRPIEGVRAVHRSMRSVLEASQP